MERNIPSLFLIFLACGSLLNRPLHAATVIPPSDARILSMGRIDRSDPGAWAFDWAAVNFRIAIKGREAWFLVEDGGGQNHYNLYVDGEVHQVVRAGQGLNRIGAKGLSMPERVERRQVDALVVVRGTVDRPGEEHRLRDQHNA